MTYIDDVLRLYVQLSDTPDHAQRRDRLVAAQLQRQKIPVELVRAALLCGVARRLDRPGPRLPPIRSLYYFLPIIEELRHDPIDPGYLLYLEHWIARHSR
jgi:hypothetical protein